MDRGWSQEVLQKWQKSVLMEEMNSADRLAAFEKMLAAMQKEYGDILEKMDGLKAQGKVKTVTYQQLMSRKLMYQNMLSLYQIYGLIEKGEAE